MPALYRQPSPEAPKMELSGAPDGGARVAAVLTEPQLDGHGQAAVQPLVEVAQDLRAITVELRRDSVPDLVRLAGAPERRLLRSPELCLLGAGAALTIPLAESWASPSSSGLVNQVLHAIRAEVLPLPRGPGTTMPLASGAVAMGALPYDPGSAGHLTVPQLLVADDSESVWATFVVDRQTSAGLESEASVRRAAEDQLADFATALPRGPLPDGFELRAAMSHQKWEQLVRRAVADMGSGGLDKVVLARRVDVVANRPFVVPEVLARLAALYPSCTVFHVEGFLGASPETLVLRSGREVLSHPLAGTVARSGDEATDSALLAGLLASAKDRREHQLVVDAIVQRLRPLCAELEVPPEPSVLALRNVSHLATLLRGSLAVAEQDEGNGGALPSSLDLAALLQPTPAVGGHPTAAALQWQRANEGFDRGCYAGPVGWVDSRGDGLWVLGLRSAMVSGQYASLYAGNGIVAGSGPEAELAETQLKLQALLAALVRP